MEKVLVGLTETQIRLILTMIEQTKEELDEDVEELEQLAARLRDELAYFPH